MMEVPYIVMARFQARPEKELELKKLLMEVVLLSKREKACLKFKFHQEIENPHIFVFYEVWQNKEAFQDYLNRPYIINVATQLHALLERSFEMISAIEV